MFVSNAGVIWSLDIYFLASVSGSIRRPTLLDNIKLSLSIVGKKFP